MNHAVGALSRVTTASVVAFLFVACNAILENRPGVPEDEAGARPAPIGTSAPPESPSIDTPMDAGGSDVGALPDADEPSSPGACPNGLHLCNGTCVGLNDPVYGCGDPSCAPCPSTHSTMGCQGPKCIVATCDPGYADCNLVAGDGCETELSKPTSCGACNAVCAVAAPLCTPLGPSFQCTNGCTPDAPVRCGNDCVDLMTSATHCGGCNTSCPAVANATIACALGVCTFTCKPLFHACAGGCVADTSPTACGLACTVCPSPAGGIATCTNAICGTSCPPPSHLCGGACVTNAPTACGPACVVCVAPANAVATCVAETCGFTCSPGFGNCDGNLANGCEATLASDPLDCGACGTKCAGLCVKGVCQPPIPPPLLPGLPAL